MRNHPEAITEIATRAFARAKDEAIRENDRRGVPSYGSKDGQIVVRQPPQGAAEVIDWSRCPDVESVPGRCGGAWVVKNSRVIVETCILGNAEDCTPEEIADLFEVPVDVVRRVLRFAYHAELNALTGRGRAPLTPEDRSRADMLCDKILALRHTIPKDRLTAADLDPPF
jgi:uncharacterized protein (DUF433 family)